MRRVLLALSLVGMVTSCSSGTHSSRSAAPTPVAPPGTGTTVAIPTTASPPSGEASPTTAGVSADQPCAGNAPPPAWQHVVWILMENHGLHQIAGSARYLDSLARQCALAVNYSAITHPSLPNYIALTSGSTQGISDDNDPSAHRLDAGNIFAEAGTWRSLEESMPGPCHSTSAGEYAVRHNPAAYYTDLGDCGADDVALGDPPDVSARFTFITPNLCNDMHDCSVSQGDQWLAREVPKIIASAEYRSGTTALFITWDEDESGGTLVPLYAVAPSVRPGTTVSSAADHYSLLRTTEEMLGLPFLGHSAAAPSLRQALHL